MKKMSHLDRLFLLITGLLAAYQVVSGVEGLEPVATWALTIAFGVLLVTGLLLIILGFETLESPLVVIAATLIPLSLSLGLVWEFLAAYRTAYLLFAIIGLLLVILTRAFPLPGRLATIVTALVHGVAGITIFLLPIVLSLQGVTPGGFALVGVGGALIGLGGVLLSFLKAGKPLLSRDAILTVLPGLLLLMATAFVAGFAAV
jgi:hypothetical protein